MMRHQDEELKKEKILKKIKHLNCVVLSMKISGTLQIRVGIIVCLNLINKSTEAGRARYFVEMGWRANLDLQNRL